MKQVVSCIVPVFNDEAYIEEALQSILHQTYSRLEIIVVDDGSTDKTPDKVNAMGGRITYLRQDHAGPSAARNRGILASSGEFIAFLDSDDLWHPEKIQKQVDYMNANPDMDVCFTQLHNFWEPEAAGDKQKLDDKGLVKIIPPYSPCSFFGRRTVFDKVGMFPPELVYGEDAHLFNLMKEAGLKMDVLAELLVSRRIHKRNLTRHMPALSREDLLQTAKEALLAHRAKEKPVPSKAAVNNNGLSFFDTMRAAFDKEAEKNKNLVFDYSAAGHTFRLKFSGPALVPLMTPAFEHIRTAPLERPELTIYVHDFAASGSAMPSLPWGEERTVRGEIPGFDEGNRVRAAFNQGAGSVHLFDSDTNTGFYGIRDSGRLAQYETGAPFLRIFHWWFRQYGIYLLHAGAVGVPGAGVLFAGKGGSGKSTTSLACLGSDLLYLSDDYCLVNTQGTPEIFSLYCTGKIHRHAVEKFPHLKSSSPEVSNPDPEKKIFFLYPEHREKIALSLPLRAVLVPVVHDSPETLLIPAAPSVTMTALIPSTLFQIAGPRSKDFYEIAEIIKKMPGYVLKIGTDPSRIPPVVSAFLASLNPAG